MPNDIVNKVLRYELDLTGLSPNNLIEDEVISIGSALQKRAVVLSNGLFYTESLVIFDNVTNRRLVKNVDYIVAQLNEDVTARTGKEVCGVVIIINTTVSPDVRFNYQCVGGQYILSVTGLENMLATLNLDERPVYWGEILGKPNAFPPGHHLHDAGDVYGFELLILALEEVRKAIIMGDTASHDEILAAINANAGAYDGVIAALQNALNAHINNSNNPHSTNKNQIGLNNIENYSIADKATAENGVSNSHYMTPLRVKEAINVLAGNLLNQHIQDNQNPHNTTKAQVGLGSVNNFDIADKPTAEAGVSNVHYMTPLRVKEAINVIAGNALNQHIQNDQNPHNTTKSQVGLGFVENYPIADQAEAESGNSSAKYMTPLRVKQAINILAGNLLNEHVNNSNNPHGVNKTQIGLGNVENYTIADSETAIAGNSNSNYMTPVKVKEAIRSHIIPVTEALNYHKHSGLVNGTGWASLDSNGNFVASGDISNFSDATLKKDIQTIIDPIGKIMKLNGVSFRYINNDLLSAGVLAQDVKRVLPMLVGIDPKTGKLIVNYSGLSSLFVESIKTLVKRIEVLEGKSNVDGTK